MRVTPNGPDGRPGAEAIQHSETMHAQQRPSTPEGVFVLPEYESSVDPDYRKLIDQGEGEGFRWYIEERTTDDGIRFDVGYFEPDEPITDIAWAVDTSWTTQVAGLNSHTASKIARAGMKAIVKGPEKNVSIPLSHSAFLTHALLDATDEEGFSRPKVIAHKGFSRGAMIGFGVNAYAPIFGRQLIYSERDDPCVAHHILELTRDEIVDYLGYVPEELFTVGRQLGSILLDPRRLKHYVQTVDLSPNGLIQVVRTGRPLFGGEAGLMAELVPDDAQMHVTFQRGMPANHREDYKRRLAGRDGVVIKEYRGTHVQHISRKHAGRFTTRLSGLVVQLGDEVPVDELDFTQVHLPQAA